jgi:uncharacterized alkaline shock family protein YloU
MQETVAVQGGQIRIADDVIATIARIAAEETPGVTGTIGGWTEEVAKRVTGKGPQKGVMVEAGQLEAIIDLRIEVHYGVKIQEVCSQLQENVRNRVEEMTGLVVKEVNVKVDSVKMDIPKPVKEEEPVAVAEPARLR